MHDWHASLEGKLGGRERERERKRKRERERERKGEGEGKTPFLPSSSYTIRSTVPIA